MTPTVERIIEHWRNNKKVWDRENMRPLPNTAVIGGLMTGDRQIEAWWLSEKDKYPYAVCVVCMYVMGTGCDYLFEIPADAVKVLAACGNEQAIDMLPAVLAMNGGEP